MRKKAATCDLQDKGRWSSKRIMLGNCIPLVKWEQSDGEKKGIQFTVTNKRARQVRIENDNGKT